MTDNPYRLPRHALPTHYDIHLEPDLENGMDVYEVCAGCHLPEGWGKKDGTFPQLSGQHKDVRDLLVLHGQRGRIEAEWARLARLRTVLNAWRLVHVPCSVALLALVLVHVLSIWYY